MKYYDRVFGNKNFHLVTVSKPNGFYYQGETSNGKKVGRPFKINGDSHRRLAKMFPGKIPPPAGFAHSGQRLVSDKKRNITRGWKSKDWQEHGFSTAKHGKEVQKILNETGINFFSSPEVLSKVLNNIQGLSKDKVRDYLNKMSKRLTVPFRKVGDVVEVEDDHNFKNVLKCYKFTTKGNIIGRVNGVYEYFKLMKPVILQKLVDMFVNGHMGINFFMTTTVDFRNELDPNRLKEDHHIKAETKSFLKHDYLHRIEDLHTAVDYCVKQTLVRIDEFILNGSGFVLDRVKSVRLYIAPYKPKNGRGFFRDGMEPFLKKYCLYIPQNDDDFCAWYCLVYNAEAKKDGKNAERISKLKKHQDKYPIDASLFPLEVCVKSSRIDQLEALFQTKINIHVTTTEKPTEVETYYVSKSNYENTVDLLLIQNLKTGNKHFALIKDYNRFRAVGRNIAHVCRNCDRVFQMKDSYNNHVKLCKEHRTTVIKMPKKGENILKFKAHGNKQLLPYTIIWDTETYFVKKGNSKGSNSVVLNEHRPSGVFALLYSTVENKVVKTFHGTGEGCVKRMMTAIYEHVDTLNRLVFGNPKPIEMTNDDWKVYQTSQTCYLCSETFASKEECEEHWNKSGEEDKKTNKKRPHPKRKVRDHCHLTGKFRGAACNQCNMLMRLKRVVPMVAHNCRGYDSHFFLQAIDKDDPLKEIKVIPTNTENYLKMSATLKQECGPSIRIDLLDSFSHLGSSLDKLAKLLNDDQLVSTKEFIRSMSKSDNDFQIKFNLAKTKGVYPYEYFDSLEKFKETSLPPVQYFVSSLEHHGKTFQQLSTKQRLSITTKYRRALKMWEAFEFNTLQEYHDFYLQLDVYLLCDVWQNYRKTCFEKFELDPSYYPTLPSFCWDAMLKKTEVELELLTDENMYMLLERGKIGGISMVGSKSYSEANHPLLSSYDASKLHKFIKYADVNGLYSWAMKQLLPYKKFRWIPLNEFDLQYAIKNADSENGCILRVDFDIPEELHDKFKDYPILPENIAVTDNMLSAHQRKIKETLLSYKSFNETEVKKLIPNLYNKKDYVIHIKHLALAIELCGDAFDVNKHLKIHQVLGFKQRAWLKPYIDLCMTERQKDGISDFEKDFWKLCSNAVYGKTMENTRDRYYLEFYNDEEVVKEKVNDLRFDHFTIETNGVVGIYKHKKETHLNKPIYAGFTVLNLAKYLMYDLWYNKLKRQYGSNISLLYTDTDSFIFEVQTDDFDQEVDKSLWDFSNYPPNHPLYSKENKTKEGFIKDETKGVPIVKFCGNRAKSYAYMMDDTVTQMHDVDGDCPTCKGECGYCHQKVVGKGINKSILKTCTFDQNYRAKHHNFEETNMCQTADIVGFQSNKHVVTTVKMKKALVSSYDDKHYWTDQYGINQLPYGHKGCIY